MSKAAAFAGAILSAALCAGLCTACAGTTPPARARVAIRCAEPDAELTVDGVPRGEAGDYAGGAHHLLLAPGPHVLVLRGRASTETRNIQVGPEDNLTLTIALAESPRGEQGEVR